MSSPPSAIRWRPVTKISNVSVVIEWRFPAGRQLLFGGFQDWLDNHRNG